MKAFRLTGALLVLLALAACQTMPASGTAVCDITMDAALLERVKAFTPVDPLATPKADLLPWRGMKTVDTATPDERLDAVAIYLWAHQVEACAAGAQGDAATVTKLVLVADAARLLRYGLMDMAAFNTLRREVDAAVQRFGVAAAQAQTAIVPGGRPPPRP